MKQSALSAMAVIGFVLAAVVAWVQLRPQITVTTHSAEKQAFSPPFIVSNVGYLALSNVKLACYINELELAGNTFTRSSFTNGLSWTFATLSHNKTRAITCDMDADMLPTKADVAIVVEFATPLFGTKKREYFRFVGERREQWEWMEADPAPIQADADKAVDAIRAVNL